MNTNQIIDNLGGTCAVAELCEVTTGAVSQWRLSGIPKARLMFLQAIRPDVFSAPSESDPECDPDQRAQAEAA